MCLTADEMLIKSDIQGSILPSSIPYRLDWRELEWKLRIVWEISIMKPGGRKGVARERI